VLAGEGSGEHKAPEVKTLDLIWALSPYRVISRQLLSNGCCVMVCGGVVHMYIHPAKVQDKCVYSQTVSTTTKLERAI